MTQHPIEQPTQPWYDPDGPPPPPPADAETPAKKKGKKKPAPAAAAAAPEAAHETQPLVAGHETQPLETHPIEHTTVAYGPGAGPGAAPTPGTGLTRNHPNEQVTVNYGGKHPDENATERIAGPDSHLTRPLNAATRAAASKKPKAAAPASGIRTPKPPTTTVTPGSKSRLMTGLLAIFLGGLGVHRFYLGYPGVGLAMLVGSVFLSFLSAGLLAWIAPAWGVVEGILYLSMRKGYWSRDAKGVPLHD